MMLESGLRPETLTQLQYKNIREDFETSKVPMKIDLPSEILKDRVEARWTFIGEEGFKVLKEYLRNRTLTDEDYIYVPNRPGTAKVDEHLGDKAFSSVFGRLARKLKMVEKTKQRKPTSVRLYCLRKYFRNYMTCDRSYREYWMGHDIGTDDHYISRDPERHRQEYLKGYPTLRIYEESDVSALSKKLAEKDEEIKKLKLQIEELEPIKDRVEFFAKSWDDLTKKTKEMVNKEIRRLNQDKKRKKT